MSLLVFFFILLWHETVNWGMKDGVLHNSIWLEQAAGVYHRESRKGRYQLTLRDAKVLCNHEGGNLATYNQLMAAQKIGFHVCAAGWLARGKVGYPIVKPGPNCGHGKTGIIDYGYRVNKSEQWDAYCYNPNAKQCGGVLTDPERIITSPDYPNEYEHQQICYWHIRIKYKQRVHIRFLEFDVEDDPSCLSDYLEIYDSYDDVLGFVGRFCGDQLPEDIISTGNVMTLKFLSDSSVSAKGFVLMYQAINSPTHFSDPDSKNSTRQ
ncbi:tumor necrosis factor-inducible gene 6 protein [Leucoraja erinacea]|uniref:tumor necrosis factor-inducible gene 6 protein n=1 Tax=Leucoraja erinaceus TaxID=7782 RepID=UPI002457677B|nr:tumor necrosis factor-inducible gene 6 protein [Leucoraja erinacea]